MVNSDMEWQLRLGQLSATNLGSVMTEALISPTLRSALIKNLEDRAPETLNGEERMWLEWCKALK